MIPNLDHPFGGTCQENTGHVRIPSNVVDGRIMSRIRFQKSGTVFRRAFVNQAFIGAHQKHGIVIGIKGHATSPIPQVGLGIFLGKVMQSFGKGNVQCIRVP